jgi:hypothetical protein
MEASNYCECSNCSYYVIDEYCPEVVCETNAPTVTPTSNPTVEQTPFPTVLTVTVETSDTTTILLSAVGSIVVGVLAGYFLRGCMVKSDDDKLSSVVPVLERDIGESPVKQGEHDIENPINEMRAQSFVADEQPLLGKEVRQPPRASESSAKKK